MRLVKKLLGYIQIRTPAGGGRKQYDIHLGDATDSATLAHETFHMLADVFGTLAQRPDAPRALRLDYAALLRWMGFASHAQRVAEARERSELGERQASGVALSARERDRLRHLEAKEERAAYGWEEYLLERRAPSQALDDTFASLSDAVIASYGGPAGDARAAREALHAHFRRWYGEELGLTDEIRGVFDRMLSSAPRGARPRR